MSEGRPWGQHSRWGVIEERATPTRELLRRPRGDAEALRLDVLLEDARKDDGAALVLPHRFPPWRRCFPRAVLRRQAPCLARRPPSTILHPSSQRPATHRPISYRTCPLHLRRLHLRHLHLRRAASVHRSPHHIPQHALRDWPWPRLWPCPRLRGPLVGPQKLRCRRPEAALRVEARVKDDATLDRLTSSRGHDW